jgi:hypothetical protein
MNPGAAATPNEEWNGKTPFMSPAELEAYEKTTVALRARTAALLENSEKLKIETDEMRKHRLEIEDRMERMMQRNAKRAYQTEINGVAINVLVSILTKDALKGMRDSEYAQSSKLDITETVDFSLMVAKRYIDELHKISVSQKQLEEYREQIQTSVDLQQQGVPMPMPSPFE